VSSFKRKKSSTTLKILRRWMDGKEYNLFEAAVNQLDFLPGEFS
jgi:hypothetical protein